MPLNIPLIDGWKIKSDTHNVILVKEVNGKDYHPSYYGTVEACISGFIDKRIREFDSQSISELLKEIKKLHTRLNLVLTPFRYKVIGGKS